MYEADPQECQLADPEWYEVIDSLGVDKIKSYEYNKSKLRRLLDGRPEPTGPADIKRITNRFRVGNTYTKASIRDYLNKVKGIAGSQAADLKEIFEIKDTTLKGSPAYKIVRRL